MPGVIPTWLMAAQPPLREWLALLARIIIAAFITASIVTLLGIPFEPAAWSVVAVVAVTGYSAGASVASGINRMQGSVVGCLSGAVCEIVFGSWLWLPVIVVLAIALSMTLCRLLRIGAGFRIGGALAGFFVFVPGAETWQTVGWRLAATLIGIAIAMIVVFALWPARSDQRVRDGIATPIRQAVVVVDAAMSRWVGDAEPAGADAARRSVEAGTIALSGAMVDRSHERAGSWEPSTYTALLANLNEALLSARRLDRVASHQAGERAFTHVAQPFGAVVDDCRAVAELVADDLTGGDRSRRSELQAAAARLGSSAEQIATALEVARAGKQFVGDSVRELQQLFAIALLLEHWSDAVRALASSLAEA